MRILWLGHSSHSVYMCNEAGATATPRTVSTVKRLTTARRCCGCDPNSDTYQARQHRKGQGVRTCPHPCHCPSLCPCQPAATANPCPPAPKAPAANPCPSPCCRRPSTSHVPPLMPPTGER